MIVRTATCFWLLCTMLLTLPQLSVASEVHVFVYHRFGDNRYPSTNIALDAFEGQLRLLRDGNWTVLTLGEVVQRLRAATSLPERCAVLTIDDAFDSFLADGVPLLRRFGFPATLFVNTDAIGTPGNATWTQLRQLAASGIEIGNQSASHAYLLDRWSKESPAHWQERVRADLRRAQDALRVNLGKPAQVFAYPYGEHDPELQALVRAEGFLAAAAQTSGVIGPQSDLYALPRFPMGGRSATVAEFERKLSLHPLPVTVLDPRTTIINDEELPELTLVIDASAVDLGRLQCFVDGEPRCHVRRLEGTEERFLVTEAGKFSGRRAKVTLTAPGRRGWYWFSLLLIRPHLPATAPALSAAGDADERR